MLILFMFLLIICFLVFFLAYMDRSATTVKDAASPALVAFVAVGIIMIAGGTVGRLCSYGSYLDKKAFSEVTVYQFISEIQDYLSHSGDIEKIAALTDSRGEGYQGELSDKINNLQRNVRHYNNWVVSNRSLSTNPLTFGLFHPPNGLQLIRVTNLKVERY